MKKKNLPDERVMTQRRQLQSEAFVILLSVLLISIVVQRFLLDAPFQQYAAELVCSIAILFYLSIRNIALGGDLLGNIEREKNIALISGLVVSILVTAIHGVASYTQYRVHFEHHKGFFIASLAIFLISTSFLSFVLIYPIYKLCKNKQAKIQKQLDKDEYFEKLHQ